MWPSTSLSRLTGWLLLCWKPLAVGLAALIVFWLGWHARATLEEARLARRLQSEIHGRRVAEERAATISREAEGELATLRETNRTLARRTAHETTDPDYRTRLPDPGRLLWNAACCGDGAGQPDPAVPAPPAAR